MKLDVGCGNTPIGDVNIDLIVHPEAKNFIKADALHLPFKAKCFTTVLASHIIEHLDNPLLLLEELKRISKKSISILTPFWFSYEYFAFIRGRSHKLWFFPSWFKKLGFHTKVRAKLLRPIILGKKAPIYFPFFEIIADRGLFG